MTASQQERVRWIQTQTVPEGNSEAVAKKKKKRDKTKRAQEQAPAPPKEVLQSAPKEEPKEEDSGFTVVKKGVTVSTVLDRRHVAPVSSLFGDSSSEEGDMDLQVAASLSVEDDMAWEGFVTKKELTCRLSPEEMENQRILLAYYKQQKEKKKQVQKARSQLEGAVKESSERILKESEGRLEMIMRRNAKKATELREQLSGEMSRIATKKEEFEKETRDGLNRIQSIQSQIATLQKEITQAEESKRVVEKCNAEMKRMQERLNAEYMKKVSAIRKKSNTKKRSEIQVKASPFTKG